MADGWVQELARIRDEDVYDYRKSKEISQRAACNEIRATDTSTKYSVRTSVGWVDTYIYYPEERTSNAVTFMFHGGGFCLGYWEFDAPYCQLLCDRTGGVVVNVDYVLAPEYKYPLTYTVSYEVVKHFAAHAESLGIQNASYFVCGSSAGANISAGLVQLSCADKDDDAIAFAGLIMNYPALKMQPEGRDAIDPNRCIAPLRMLQYMAWQYEKPEQMWEPLASPVFASPDVAWPDTLVNVAGFDSLKAETDEFCDKLKSEGARVSYKCYPEAEHGFTHRNLKEYREGDASDAWNRIIEFIASHSVRPSILRG